MPKADRIMIFTISQCAKKEIEYTRFRCELSLINKTLLEQGIDMKLPRYWGLVGEYPEWNTIMERVEKWGYYFNMKQIASHYPVLKDKPSGVNPQAGHDE